MCIGGEMKKKLILLITVTSLCLYGCRSLQPIYNAVAIHDDANTITLRCNGYGKTESDAIADAGRYAIERVLFRGVPNSNQRNPLIGVDENTAKKQHAQYLQELLDNERYLSFLTKTISLENGRSYGKTWVVADVTINLRALRNDLEQAGVIRKFGY